MNSNSKHYCDDPEPCKKEKIKPATNAFVKCGAAGAISIPLGTLVGTTFTPATLTLNTAGMCNPCTKIEVTMNLVTTAFTGAVSFQVFKQCRNQFQPIALGSLFTYSEAAAVTNSSTFSFFVCDCDNCDDDCCVLTLVATVTTVTAGTLNVNNVALSTITSSQVGCDYCY